MAKNSFWTKVSTFRELKSLLLECSEMLMKVCNEVVLRKKLMTKLRNQGLMSSLWMLLDPVVSC